MRASSEDRERFYDALLDEAVCEAEADGTPLAIPSVVDRLLARHDIGPDGADELRERLIKDLSELVEFPCEVDLGPTSQCRFMQGHLDEGLDHEPTGRMHEPLIQEIDEWLYLRGVDPDLQA